jgi:hypothetical protein
MSGVADRFNVSVDEVREAQSQLAAFSDGDALRLDWMLESKRLAAVGMKFYQIAMRDADGAAAMIFIKASERRATLMGANAPAAATVKLIHDPQPEQHKRSKSMHEMRGLLDNIMGITFRERQLLDQRDLEATRARKPWPRSTSFAPSVASRPSVPTIPKVQPRTRASTQENNLLRPRPRCAPSIRYLMFVGSVIGASRSFRKIKRGGGLIFGARDRSRRNFGATSPRICQKFKVPAADLDLRHLFTYLKCVRSVS